MSNMSMFCSNIFPINHLQNLSSYEIVSGHKLPAIMDLQPEGDDLTHPTFYRFADYLDLQNECVHAIRDIVKEHHNQTIQQRLVQHGSESPTLRSFSEGDIVYCHFPSKNYYLGPKTTIQEIANVSCWTIVHFRQIWQIHVPPIYNR